MKVNAWKNIDVEVEVDVTLDDVLNELLDIADSSDGQRRKLSAIDGATKVLQKIGTAGMIGIADLWSRRKAAETVLSRLMPFVHGLESLVTDVDDKLKELGAK